MSYRQTLAQLFWRAVEDPEFFHSIKSHKRYHLRLIAIIANNIGLFFNILAVCLAHDKILNGLAFLPVGVVQLPILSCQTTADSSQALRIATLECLRSDIQSSV